MATPALLTGSALAAARQQEMDQVRAVNAHRSPQIAAQGITVHYDPDDDTLLLHIGPPRPATSVTVDDRIYFRVDPTTLELVGIEVVDLHAPVDPPALRLLLKDLLEAAASSTLAEDVRALVEA